MFWLSDDCFQELEATKCLPITFSFKPFKSYTIHITNGTYIWEADNKFLHAFTPVRSIGGNRH